MAGTIVGSGLSVEGELVCEEEVIVYGTLRGSLVTTDAVAIGEDGVVEADIEANALSVAGRATGNVNVQDRVDIQAGGRLIGDVRAARLTIGDGASFKGAVDMDV